MSAISLLPLRAGVTPDGISAASRADARWWAWRRRGQREHACDKIGEGAPLGEVFVGRVPTGRIGLEDDSGDNVQTRVLWLDGVEPENENTKSRYIYIHGTNAESKLGTPSSHGCVRMGNQDIAELFDFVSVGTPVQITTET